MAKHGTNAPFPHTGAGCAGRIRHERPGARQEKAAHAREIPAGRPMHSGIVRVIPGCPRLLVESSWIRSPRPGARERLVWLMYPHPEARGAEILKFPARPRGET